MKRSYAVIGLGKFGYNVAMGLIKNNENVILCDNRENTFSEFKDKADQIYVLDSTDKLALQEAGIVELDVAIVSIGESIEASVLTVMALKELHNRKIIAKAVSVVHGEILEKLGVDYVIYPDRQAAQRLLSELINANIEEIDLSANMKSCKTIVSSYFAKRSIEDVKEYDGVRIVAVKRDEEWNLDFDSDFILQKDDVILFLGGSIEVSEITKKIAG